MSRCGMTRRIDELGRLVIPKEIRKNLKIKDNDQIEINIIDNKIVLSKYDFLDKDEFIHKLLLCAKKLLNKNILFTSREKIIDYTNLKKEAINNVYLNSEVMNIIEKRCEVISNTKNIKLYNETNISSYIISPLIVKGDLYGSLILYSDDEVKEIDSNIISFIKTFLENYLE